MGFRARKSFKVMPGVRMTVTPRGVGLSAGVRGARVSVHSSGRVTKTVGIPGTGVSHVTTSTGRINSTRSAPAPVRLAPAAPSPGMFAPKADKALYRAIMTCGSGQTFAQVAASFPETRRTAALYELMVVAGPAGDDARAIELLDEMVESGFDPQADAFFLKYTPRATMGLEIADGVSVTLHTDKDALGLALAELLQKAGQLDRAIRVVENLEPTSIAAVSLAELYADQARWADILELTEGVTNEDDATTYLLVQRGHAFREQGLYTAARETLKEALRLRSRSADLRLPALVERGLSYLAEGKPAMARKDFERVLAEKSDYPGIAQLVSDTSVT